MVCAKFFYMKFFITLVLFALSGTCSWAQVGEVAFISNRDGYPDIFLVDLEKGQFRNLTNDAAIENDPAWSPDGSQLVYASNRNDNNDIYLFNFSGSTIINLTDHPAVDAGASWSPDAREVVFISNRDHPLGEIYVMNVNTRAVKRLTFNEYYEVAPKFSSDGSKIAFCRQLPPEETGGDAPDTDVFILDRASNSVQKLTSKPEFDCHASWSDDDRQLLFHSCSSGKCSIFVINADGANMSELTPDVYDNRWPSWSPDGTWIIYTSIREGDSDIWIMKNDGTEKQSLISSPYRDENARWRP
jgi:TolB protein